MSHRLEVTSHAEATHFWFHGFRAVVAPIVAGLAGSRRDLRLIDCGCGTGYNLKTLLLPYGRPFAFDLDVEAIQRTRVYGRPVVRADLEHIPFTSNTFDIATSFDVIQSVPDDVKALTEMARVLKPGGHIVVNVVALEILRGDHSDVWDELRRYTRGSAERAVRRAGLEPVQISYLFASLVPLMLATRRVERVLRRFRAPSGDADLSVPAAPMNAVLTWIVKREAALARRVAMPFGSSLLIVARKPL